MDNRLHPARRLEARRLREDKLDWLVTGDNADYLAEDYLVIHSAEKRALTEAAASAHLRLLAAARHLDEQNLWRVAGMPASAVPLLRHSLRHEAQDFLLGRFDFAGGLNGLPIRLLEYNADTFSLLPETALIQNVLAKDARQGQPYNEVMPALETQFRNLLRRYPNREPFLLVSSLGSAEDNSNVDTIARAARAAGFEMVYNVDLEAVIFDPNEGIFIEMDQGRYLRCDFWFKMVPWDFIVNEEPELFTMLERLVLDGKVTVLNPAFSMILQNKALLPLVQGLFPNDPLYLPASISGPDRLGSQYVRKPIFGRMGENVALYRGGRQPVVENDGDFGHQPMVYQAWAEMAMDGEGYRYQPSVFYAHEPCAIAVRRQEGELIDDDAEFIAHVVEP